MLTVNCEVFPFVVEMGADAFCTMLSKCEIFPLLKHRPSEIYMCVFYVCVYIYIYVYMHTYIVVYTHIHLLTNKAKPRLFARADGIFLDLTCRPFWSPESDCVMWVLMIFSLSLPGGTTTKRRLEFRSKWVSLLLQLTDCVNDTTPNLNVFALFIIWSCC